MQPDIQNWLNGNRDYVAGVVLLKKYGKTGFVVTMLEKGPDAYNTPKLLSELQKVGAMSGEVRAVSDEKVAIKEVLEKSVEVGAKGAPHTSHPVPYVPDLNLEKKLRIDASIKTIWKELTHLHGQLSVLPEGEKLYECASLILKKDAKRRNLWDQLHYFEQNGIWFDERPENKPKPFDLEKEIKNIRASRSKAKKLLETIMPKAKRQHQERRVAEFDKELERLTKLRNGNN